MRCKDCKCKMVHIDIHKNDGKKPEDFEPETYICPKCDRIEYI